MHVGLQEWSELFLEQGISNGDMLLRLTEDMLINDLGIKQRLQVIRFLKELTKLKIHAEYDLTVFSPTSSQRQFSSLCLLKIKVFSKFGYLLKKIDY